MDDKAKKQFTPEARKWLAELAEELAKADWRVEVLEAAVRGFAEARRLKLGQIAQPLRAALTGSAISPGIFEVMVVLGRAEAIGRIVDSALTGR